MAYAAGSKTPLRIHPSGLKPVFVSRPRLSSNYLSGSDQAVDMTLVDFDAEAGARGWIQTFDVSV